MRIREKIMTVVLRVSFGKISCPSPKWKKLFRYVITATAVIIYRKALTVKCQQKVLSQTYLLVYLFITYNLEARQCFFFHCRLLRPIANSIEKFLSVSSALTGSQGEKIGGGMSFCCLMFDTTAVWGPRRAAGQAFRFGPAVTSFLFQVSLCCRHLPFGPSVEHWHAQRHIGFHYFHSYEGATVDSDWALTAALPPREHFPITLKLGLVLQWKTKLFRCHLMILHHVANEMFYAVAGILPPGGSSKEAGRLVTLQL